MFALSLHVAPRGRGDSAWDTARRRFATWRSSATAASGKTSLHEALLFEAGVLNRLGSVPGRHDRLRHRARRAGAADVDLADAQRRSSGTGARSTCSTRPGEPSFIADALGALRVCESAVFVINAVMGAEVTTQRLWKVAAERDIARMLFVNMLDRERADFYRTLESLKAAFGPHVVATEIPIGVEHERQRRDRPRRHARLPLRGRGPRQRGRDRDPRRGGRARRRSTARS